MSTKPKAKSLSDFRAAHDKNVIVPGKIRSTLDAMEADGGPENWHYEGDFIKLARISQTDIGMFRDQFSAHVIETSGRNPKRVWVASVKAATKFRENVG